MKIGHEFATADELVQHALTLTGHTSGDLARATGQAAFNKQPTAKGKTGVGRLVELYFGKKADNEAAPDFPNLGVELKTLPMKPRTTSWTIKEPTSLSMIDPFRVDVEPWPTASLRKKIEHILWVPYEHDFDDKRRARFRVPFIWPLPEADEPLLGRDYDTVRGMIRQGRGHELSETLTQLLGARRKGQGGTKTRPQPHGPPMKSRAWAFKAAYTRPILVRHVLAAPLVSIVEAIPAVRSLQDVEPFVEAKLGEYVGLTLDQIATRAGGRIAASKSGPAAFVRRTLGLGDKGTIEEFEKLGIRVHTLWLRDHDLYPWEAVSFPAMRLREFAAEDWEESELLDHVDNILFVPLLSPTRSARGSRALGRAFFWKPSGEELAGIEKEWRVHQRLVRAGKARYRPKLDLGGARRRDARGRQIRVNDLPKTSDTKYIHMRPHGRDSADWDVDPRGNRVTKQCFWLNKALLQSSARNASPPISE